ncbi:TauD/TfdA dioxygenase family protein [Plastoroseomonas hellenica]|uniref:TauD/TfdA dioxygenase family protein n=1 Tax=Plastoroseomonas hellenica TaxID=2687306 RepID=UPI001BAC43FC|nr:TauD/TfdA family dioxygenase [Plastoroseomonas hellenica]MBR0646512.1 TauD/TfdA family dioxygenase [Plastoroseomonas hellenica]
MPNDLADKAGLAAHRGAASDTALRITPLHPVFAERAEGLDLSGPLTPAEVAAIGKAMDRYAVLVFPGQRFEDDQQLTFGRHFGEVEAVPTLVDQGRRRLSDNRVNDISNLGADGQILAADDRRRMYNLGNLLWHSDSSFKPTPAQYSMLHARVIPPEGGETEFADMRAAWDALPAKKQAEIRDLVTEHSLIFSRAQLGFDEFTPEERARCTPVPQRLVRRHQGSGRLSLYLSAHIGRIQGWPTPEAMALIRELTEFATQRQFVYSHRWAVGDLVIWDNRCTMHRGRPYEDKVHPRDLRRVTLSDSAPTLEQPV